MGLGDLHDVKVHEMLENEIREKSHASEDKEAHLQFQKSALVHEEALVTNSVQSPGSNNVVASSVGDITFSNNSEVLDQSPSTSFPMSATLQSLNLPHELTGLQVEEFQEGFETDSGFHNENGESKLSTGSVHVNNSLAGMHEHKKEKNELDEEGKTATYDNVFLGEMAREELYMFYEANKLVTKNIENLNGKRSLSSHASLLDGSTFSSSLKNTILEGADVSAQVSPKISGDGMERMMVLNCFIYCVE